MGDKEGGELRGTGEVGQFESAATRGESGSPALQLSDRACGGLFRSSALLSAPIERLSQALAVGPC